VNLAIKRSDVRNRTHTMNSRTRAGGTALRKIFACRSVNRIFTIHPQVFNMPFHFSTRNAERDTTAPVVDGI